MTEKIGPKYVYMLQKPNAIEIGKHMEGSIKQRGNPYPLMSLGSHMGNLEFPDLKNQTLALVFKYTDIKNSHPEFSIPEKEDMALVQFSNKNFNETRQRQMICDMTMAVFAYCRREIEDIERKHAERETPTCTEEKMQKGVEDVEIASGVAKAPVRASSRPPYKNIATFDKIMPNITEQQSELRAMCKRLYDVIKNDEPLENVVSNMK